eukprot:scaffold289894_cov66-Cyclotella_meneghiniana.AAC.1
MVTLTSNAVTDIFRGGSLSDNLKPFLQVVNIRQLANTRGPKGENSYHMPCMFIDPMTRLIENSSVKLNSIIKLTKYHLKETDQEPKTRFLLISECEISEDGVSRIGKSQDITNAGYYFEHAGNPYSPKISSSPVATKSSTTLIADTFLPISELNMYEPNWKLRAKVISKTSIKKWDNARSSGRLFSIVILDSAGYDIKCTFFQEAVSTFHDSILVGNTYTFTRGKVKVAEKMYNKCKSVFEITFDSSSVITPDESGPKIIDHFDFVKISDLEQSLDGHYYDVIGVVKDVGNSEK